MRGLTQLWFLLGLMALSSCTVFFEDIEVRDVRGISLQGNSPEVTVELYNPNRYKIEATAADIDLLHDGRVIGHLALPPDPVMLAPKEATNMTVICTLEPGALPAIVGGGLKSLLSGKGFEIEATGSVSGKAWGRNWDMPVEVSKTIK
jgi:hypothetical protein